MSQENVQQYVISLHYTERGLSDLLELTSALENAGFSTTLNDEDGHPHDLGSNHFGLVSALPADEVQRLAQGLAESVLEGTPRTEVTLWQTFRQQHGA